MPHTVKVKCNILKKDVILLNSIMDSYENIALVRTVDAKTGSVVLYATNNTYETVLRVLEELKKEGVQIENISTQESENVDEW
jgi:predicted regulator of amino acid metabolism with ACT domain